MEKTKVYATLVADETWGWKRIRFSKAASQAFDGFSHCDISKTGDNKYIIFTPHHEWENNPALCKLHVDTSGGVVIACKRHVVSGFFKAEWFGKSYKVKKMRDGRIVICLSEEVG